MKWSEGDDKWHMINPVNDKFIYDFFNCDNFFRVFDQPDKTKIELYILDIHRFSDNQKGGNKMSVNREDLTSLKESFWKEPEPIKEDTGSDVKLQEGVEETATNEEAQAMVDSGEATIPEEAVVSEEVAKAEEAAPVVEEAALVEEVNKENL